MGSGSSPRTWAAQSIQELWQPKVAYFCPIFGTEGYGQWEFSKNLGSPKCIRLISAQYMALRGMGSGSSPRTWAAQMY